MHLAYVSRVYGSTDPGRYPGSTVRQTAHESQLMTPHAEGMTSTLALADAAPAAQPEPTIFLPTRLPSNGPGSARACVHSHVAWGGCRGRVLRPPLSLVLPRPIPAEPMTEQPRRCRP